MRLKSCVAGAGTMKKMKGGGSLCCASCGSEKKERRSSSARSGVSPSDVFWGIVVTFLKLQEDMPIVTNIEPRKTGKGKRERGGAAGLLSGGENIPFLVLR